MKRFISVALLLSGCASSVSVELSIVLPADPALRPVSLVLRMLEPPAATPFTCDEVAFSLLPQVVLTLAEQSRSTVTPGQVTKLETSRTGNRVLLVDGLDAMGTIITRGCVTLGDVERTTPLRLELEPVVQQAGKTDQARLPTGGGVPEVRVSLVDLRGQPVSGVKAVWFLAATASPDSQGAAEPSVGGQLTVKANQVSASGPFSVIVVPRWGPVITIDGMVDPSTTTSEFPPELQVVDYVHGRVGPTGQPGFTLLAGVDGGMTHVIFYGDNGNLAATGPLSSLPGVAQARVLSLLEDTPVAGRDTAVAIGTTSWVELLPSGASPQAGFNPLPALPRSAISMWNAGGCAQAPTVVLVTLANGTQLAFDRQGTPTAIPALPTSGEVLTSGCLSQADGKTFATSLVNTQQGVLVAPHQTPGAPSVMPFVGVSVGASFTRREPRELLATRVDRNLLLVSRLFIGSTTPLRLESSWELSIPGFPIQSAAGDLDADGRIDVVSLTVLGPESGAPPGTVVLVLGLGRDRAPPASAHVAGVLGPLPQLCNPKLWLQDLDGDGTDDVLLGERAPCSHPLRLNLYRMVRPPP